MNKIVKRVVIALSVLATLFISVIVIYALTFNPNDYKSQIIRLVQEKKQRTLTLEGDIKLLFFPKLGVDLGRSWISEKNGDRQFASLQHARFYFSWLPLLRRQVVIDGVSLEGLGAILVRHPDGSTNFADLLEQEANSWLKFNVQTLKLAHGLLVFEDQLVERKYLFTEIDLKHRAQQDITLTSKLTVARPDVNLDLKLTSGMKLAENQQLALKGLTVSMLGRVAAFSDLDLRLQGDIKGHLRGGDVSADRLSLSASGKTQSRDFVVSATLPALQLNATEFFVDKITLESTFKKAQDTLTLTAQVPAMRGLKNAPISSTGKFEWRGRQGKINFVGDAVTAFVIDVNKQEANFSKLSARLEIRDPARLKIPLAFKLDGQGMMRREPFSSTLTLKGTLNDSQLQVAGGATGAPPRYAFNVLINQINVDRYLKPSPDTTPSSQWNLSTLKNFNAAGEIRIGQLTYGQTRASNVTITLQ